MFYSLFFRILLIQNAPERFQTNQTQSPIILRNSCRSSSATLHQSAVSDLVLTTPNRNVAFERSNQPNSSYEFHRQQHSQVFANIENNCCNFELDDDGSSQISFKRHEEPNSSKGSLHNAYDNTSISTSNASATTRNFAFGAELSSLKINPGLEDVREAENDNDRRKKLGEKSSTSIFIENSDLLDDNNYPKLNISRLSTEKTYFVPVNVKKDDRRYSDTKLTNTICFENEFLVKKFYDVIGSDASNIFRADKNNTVEKNNVLQSNESKSSSTFRAKQEIFKSLPNLNDF